MFDEDVLVKITMPGRTPRRPIRQEPKIIPAQINQVSQPQTSETQHPLQQQEIQPQTQPIIVTEIPQQTTILEEQKPEIVTQEIPQQPTIEPPQATEETPQQEYNQVTGTYNTPRHIELQNRTEEYPNKFPDFKVQQIEKLAKGIFTGDFFKKK